MTPAKFKDEPCKTCGTARSVVNGAWLRRVRKDAGLSLREAARLAGYSVPYLCDVEYNRRGCTPKMRAFYEGLGA